MDERREKRKEAKGGERGRKGGYCERAGELVRLSAVKGIGRRRRGAQDV
jgi:hypothetical protein